MFLLKLVTIALAAVASADFMARLMPYRDRLFRLALAQLRNTSDAEDAVQEALIKAGRNAQQFRSESSEYTWVVRILINHCHDVQRKVSRRQKREVSGEISEAKGAAIADSRSIRTSAKAMGAPIDSGRNFRSSGVETVSAPVSCIP